MKEQFVRVVAAAILMVLTGLALPAQASAGPSAEGSVSIEQPRTVRIHQRARTAALSPVVRTHGNVRLVSQRLTVRRGRATVASEVRRVRVAPGYYSVITHVTFRTFKLVGTGKFESRRVVVAGPNLPPVSVTCTWKTMTKVGSWYGASASCVSSQFSGTWLIGDIFLDPQADGSYAGQVPMLGTPVMVPDPMALLGTTFTGTGVPQEDLYLRKDVEIMKRVYGRVRHESERTAVQVVRRSGPYVNAKGCADPSDAARLTSYTTRKRAVAVLGTPGVRWGSYDQFDWTGDGVFDGWTQQSAFRTCDPADILLVRFTSDPAAGPNAEDHVVHVDYRNQ